MVVGGGGEERRPSSDSWAQNQPGFSSIRTSSYLCPARAAPSAAPSPQLPRLRLRCLSYAQHQHESSSQVNSRTGTE